MTDRNHHAASVPLDRREIAKRGQMLYERAIRTQVETLEQIGQLIAIDIETGNYEIDDNLLAASDRLLGQFPDAIIWIQRIGFNAVYAVGGSLTKVELS